MRRTICRVRPGSGNVGVANNAQFLFRIALAPVLRSWHRQTASAPYQRLGGRVNSRAEQTSRACGCKVDGKKLAADGYLNSIHKTYYRCAYGTQLYVRVSQRLADRVRTSRKMIPPASGGSTGAYRLHIVTGMRTSDGPVHTYVVIQNCTQTRAGTVLPYTWRQVIFGRLAHHPPTTCVLKQ